MPDALMYLLCSPLGRRFRVTGDVPGRVYRILYNWRTGCFCTWIRRRDTGRWTPLNGQLPEASW